MVPAMLTVCCKRFKKKDGVNKWKSDWDVFYTKVKFGTLHQIWKNNDWENMKKGRGQSVVMACK